MIEDILPGCVATAEAFSDVPETGLFPAELAAIARAVPKRRGEFATVRHCARVALAELGVAPAAIVPGPRREPQWPPGVIGSMTHCDGYRAAAVARECDLSSLGIDAEPHQALPDGVLAHIARPEEFVSLAQLQRGRPDVHWDRLLFSAKESVYKAWFPLARRWLGFGEATITFDPVLRSFEAALHQVGPDVAGQALTQMSGRWLVRGSLLITSAAVGGRLHRTSRGPDH